MNRDENTIILTSSELELYAKKEGLIGDGCKLSKIEVLSDKGIKLIFIPATEAEKKASFFNTPITELNLSVSAVNNLKKAGIHFIKDITSAYARKKYRRKFIYELMDVFKEKDFDFRKIYFGE